LPELIKNGFEGKIYCTRATAALMIIMLQDAMILKKYNKNTIVEIREKMEKQSFRIDDFDDFRFSRKIIPVSTDFRVLALRSSHILGACSWTFQWIPDATQEDSKKKWREIHFSGDVGTVFEGIYPNLMLRDMHYPYYNENLKYIVLESTYGNRVREEGSADYEKRLAALSEEILECLREGRNILIPAFSLHRSQEILLDLYYLKEIRKIAVPMPTKQRIIERNFTIKKIIEKNDQIEAVTKMWNEHMDIPFSEDTLYSSLPGPFQDALLELMQKNFNQAKTFSVKFLSNLIDKVNAVYLEHLVTHYAHEGSLKFQYLSPEFFKYFDIEENPSLGDREETLKKVKSIVSEFMGVESGKNNRKEMEGGRGILVSASGMASAGAITEVLEEYLKNPKATIILCGYQSPKTNGYILRNMHTFDEDAKYNKKLIIEHEGKQTTIIPLNDIKCKIVDLSHFYSGHADQAGLIQYVLGQKR
jgi:Cft2 family RNA processing exonuclease